VTPGGLGPFDYFSKQTLIQFGVTGAVATSYVVALHAILLLPMTALGFVFLWMQNLSLAKIMPEERRLAQDYDPSPGKRGEE